MGRRRREPALSEILLDSPWWVSAMLALGSYLIFRAIVPAVFASRPNLAGIAMASHSLAWMPTTVFGFLGLLAYFRAKSRSAARSASPQSRDLRKQPDLTDGPVSTSVSHGHRAKPTQWSVDALGLLEWKRFEMLCVWYYEATGFTVTTVSHGADGGIDATLYKEGMSEPIAVVQCKAWQQPVKVEPVRALGGVMHAKHVKRGVFWSLTGYVGQPVRVYAAEAGIQLLDGADIIERIRALDQYKQATLLAKAFKGDYRTPTCASCGVKLVERVGKKGNFWGCRNYPAGCRFTLPYRV